MFLRSDLSGRLTISWIAAGVFAVTAAWIFFLVQGLPIGDPDDWDHVLAAKDLPWAALLKNTFRPWSSSLHWLGQTDRLNEVASRRVFLSVMLKSIGSVFGLHALPYYIFSKVIFFAGSNGLLFLILHRLSASVPLSLAGTFFYLVVPAHYAHVLWLTDPATFVHFFLLAGLWSYAKWKEGLARGRGGGWLAALVASAWLGIKTKEPALVLPCMVLGDLAVDFSFYRRFAWKSGGLMILMLAVIFQIVPANAFLSGEHRSFFFHISTVIRMLFQNYGCGYQDEVRSAFAGPSRVWPVSVARTLGFFMIWTLAAGFSFALLLKQKTGSKPDFFLRTMVRMTGFWILMEIFWMGFFQPDPRYFSGFMIPLVIILVYGVSRSLKRMRKAPKKIFAGALGLAMFLSVAANFYNILWLRVKVGQRVSRFWGLAQTFYADEFGRAPAGDVASYYCALWVPDLSKPRLKARSYFIEMGYDEWNRVAGGPPELFEENAVKGFVYAAVFSKEKYEGLPKVKRIAALDGINSKSFFERVLYRFYSKPQKLYLYRWTP